MQRRATKRQQHKQERKQCWRRSESVVLAEETEDDWLCVDLIDVKNMQNTSKPSKKTENWQLICTTTKKEKIMSRT